MTRPVVGHESWNAGAGGASVVSVIVPAWHRDEAPLEALLRGFRWDDRVEVVVAFPREDAARVETLRARHPAVRWVLAPRGRASQMNGGAAIARGRWLLFLHADCRLPAGWLGAIDRAEARPDVVGGCFRFALDSTDWRARVIELGVRLRVALLALPYGDQGLFVRRDVFEALGGYADVPLMEDVDLVRRLRRRGRLLRASLPVVSAARRWREDGWVRRTAGNLALVTRYFLGAPPAALARCYLRRHRVAVAMMARAPAAPGKTRLLGHIDAAQHAALRVALFHDTLDALRAVRGVDHIVICDPPEACPDVRASVGHDVDVLAQHSGDLGMRLAGAFEDLFRLGAAAAVIVGSDLPDLPPAIVRQAADILGRPGDRVVIGPALDGGYYLVGLKAPHRGLFAGIDWGSPAVLGQTLDRARTLGLPVELLPPWADVDDPTDLQRLARERTPGAARTRAWIRGIAGLDADAPAPAGGLGAILKVDDMSSLGRPGPPGRS